MAHLVTHHTHSADTVRERARLWRVQRLVAAAMAAGSIGAVWLAATLGGGPAAVAAVIVAGLAPLAVAAPLAAWLAGRAHRRTLLWGAPAAAGAALVACDLTAGALGVGAVIACAVVVGAARAVFDGATTDVLHHLVAPERRSDAAHDLTTRFGAGSALGVAGALGVGLVAGPHGAIAVAALLAAAGSLVASRHHPDLDLRIAGQPQLGPALRRATLILTGDPLLRRVVAAGALSAAVGAAQAAVLIVWLRDGVGLRGALAPALIAGFVAMRLGRPLVRRAAARARLGSVLSMALGVQAASALAAYGADGTFASASAYALSLAAAAFLGVLVTRALRIAAAHDLAPAVGLASGAAWALAASLGAVAGAALALGIGLAATHLVLAAVALSGAGAGAARAAVRARRRPGVAPSA